MPEGCPLVAAAAQRTCTLSVQATGADSGCQSLALAGYLNVGSLRTAAAVRLYAVCALNMVFAVGVAAWCNKVGRVGLICHQQL